MTPQLAIKGATVILPSGRFRAGIYIRNGRFIHLGSEDLSADEIVDATGLYVLPGMVDTHVHLMDPGDSDREDFPTGSAAAAAAGVTTILEHTHSHPIRSATDLQEKTAYLTGRSNVDFGLAAHTWPEEIDGLRELWRAGVAFFKIFTCTTHGVPGLSGAELKRALEMIASFGGSCLIHCEDGDLTTQEETRLRKQGRSDYGVLMEWRSLRAEELAVVEACRLASLTGARVTIAHVSNPIVAHIIRVASEAGADIAAECCPQYLAFREDDLLTQGPLFKFTPPARARSDADEEVMWGLVRSGVLSHMSTDHAPSTKKQKQSGIWEAPFGLPGIDTTGPFLIDAAVRGRLTLEDVARVYSEAPAQRFGLAPRKGRVAVGADADFVLIDESGSWKVSDSEIISKAGWSPFVDRTMLGRVVGTYLRGTLIAANRLPIDQRIGRYLPGPGSLVT